MSEAHTAAKITIKTEMPEAGPTAIITAVVLLCIAIAIVIGDVLWVGSAVAFDINSHDFNPLPLFFFVCFAAVGAFFLFRGVLHSMRYAKFGTSSLVINEARLGQSLKGIVRTERDLAPLADFKARLRCDLHTSTRNARGGQSSSTECLWESFQTVPAATRSSAGIPIDIAIPDNGVASGSRKSASDSPERVSWALEVSAPLHGTDYYAEFPLAVGGHRGGESTAAGAGGSAGHSSATHSAGPFAGYAAPRSRWSKMFFIPFLVAGALLSLAGIYTTWQEMKLTLHGARASGHVLGATPSVIDVALDTSGGSPVTVHVPYGSNFHDWQPGLAVRLTCREVKEDTRSCRMDTGFERWINTAGTLFVGVVLLLLALALRPPPKPA